MKLASLLDIEEYPDDSWTKRQWSELREHVIAELAKRDLPDFSLDSE